MQFAVFGQDARQLALGTLLRAQGHTVFSCPPHTPEPGQIVLLPVPSSSADHKLRGTDTDLSQFFASLPAGTICWGSGLQAWQSRFPSLQLFDYPAFARFEAENANITAEGALQLAMQALPSTIQNGNFLVIGYGKIGRRLCFLLHALGAHVTIARRQIDASLPYPCVQTGRYDDTLSQYDAIFNTVPAPVLSEAQILQTREDCLLIDLASAPGGIAKTAARNLIHALGLPTKTAPKTAAALMQSIVLSEIKEAL